ncbi:alpha/beta hydrolase [Priestia megaterium]|uniref:alpha/beta fold hydrolase n=1 Tax=Priestia megaterium TaxID=1404 RepID=UPI002A6A6113|nr:alpha/beta hydrolase [Priestia megaterium]MDY0943614.1 alpha/beta hydrolase [Priestia megaterium]
MLTKEERKMSAHIPFMTSSKGSRAIIFVHGFMDTGKVWDDVIASITEKDLQKVYLDLPGMGALTAIEGEISLARYARDVASVVEQIGKPFVIVGQSMGAQIAELVTRMQPRLARGLVLLTPVPLEGVKASAEVVAPLKQLGENPEIEKVLRKQFSRGLTEESLDRLCELNVDVRPDVVVSLVDMWNEGYPGGDSPSEFTRPVLIMRGMDDPFVTNEMVAGITSRFRRVIKQDIHGGGHWSHVEQSEAVAQYINQYLKLIEWE